jgi:cell division protein FtsI (penicillin-binding protein 3)
MTKNAFPPIKNRLRVAALLSILTASVLAGRLFQLQIVEGEGLESGDRITSKTFSWTPSRGLILDRNGRKLVANTEFETLVAEPHRIGNPGRLASELGPLLGISEDTLLARLSSGQKEQAIKRKLPALAARDLRRFIQVSENGSSPVQHPTPVTGLKLVREPYRNYLKGSLAGQVIGHVDIDNVGQNGIERFAGKQLEGKKVNLQVRRYGERRAILESDYTRMFPIRGADVVLTLDETIQWIAEKALAEMCEESQAKGGMAIVMKPGNGEILAMANYPFFDPQEVGQYAAAGEMERAKNRSIVDTFEPGSTMKPFIVAAGLECGVIASDTPIDCENGRRYLPASIRSKPIVDEHPMGVVPVTDVLIHSSNIGAGKIAEMIVSLGVEEPDRKKLYDYLTSYGFGEKTQIDLPGEALPVLRRWEGWNRGDLLVLAFGTGPVTVTPISLARSYCLFANGGYLVTPHVIKGLIGNRDGRFYANQNTDRVLVMSPETSQEVQEILVQVVEKNPHSNARSDWYRVGGKTGTAKKVVDGHYSSDHKLLSFAGFAPYPNPEIVVVAMIDEPQGITYGNQAGAPVFRQIVDDTLAYLHTAPDPEKPGFQTELKRFHLANAEAPQRDSGEVPVVPPMAPSQVDPFLSSVQRFSTVLGEPDGTQRATSEEKDPAERVVRYLP